MKARTVLLDDAFWFQEGPGVRKWQFATSGIKLLNVGNILSSGEIDLSRTDRFLGIEEVAKRYKQFLVDEGDLVIASSGISFDDDGLLRTRGAFIDRSHLPLCLNTSTIRFKSKEGTDLRYLRFWLDSYEFRSQISRRVTGSAQQNFGPSHLQDIRIRLPDFAEQKRIAELLEQADRVRRTRRYTLKLGGTFLPAVFLELFGDPIRNEKDWNIALLEEACVEGNGIKAGPFGSSLKKDSYSNSGIRVYGQEQVIAGDFSVGNYYINESMFEDFAAYEVKPGDVLISLVGTFGRVVVVPGGIEQGIINPRLLKISPKSSVLDSTFLAKLIEHPTTQHELMRMSHGGTMGILNAGLLRELRIVLPPLKEQQHFAALVARHERLQAEQREALRQADHLFQTVLHRSFDLNR